MQDNGFPPFSVAISVYHKDNAFWLNRALESITTCQTVVPDEIVLVCDGPLNYELNKVIDSFVSRYRVFSVIRLQKNRGLGNALRTAVENSRYELVARMDSDDVSVPDRFVQQLSFLKNNPQVDIVGGDITEFVDLEDNVVAKRSVPEFDAEIKKYLKKRCPMNHVSVMFRKTAVQSAGGYEDWLFNEDYYLWVRMYLAGCIFANTGTVLVNVRVGKEMYQRRGGLKYCKSELGIQNYMLKNRVISLPLYLMNCLKRIIVELLLPVRIRSWVYKKFARE